MALPQQADDYAFRGELRQTGESPPKVRGDLGAQAGKKIDRARIATAENIESVAGKLHRGARRLPTARMEDVAHSTAQRLESAAGRLRRNDVGRVTKNAANLLKDNPGIALLAAVTLGFLAGRAMGAAARR